MVFPPIHEASVPIPMEIKVSPQASATIGEEARKKNRGRIVDTDLSDDDVTHGTQGVSLATGIPSWDKGVEANESMATS